ncbi:hypothetical protein [Rurimicrobium arvi]|uniref:Transporter n=1 Tax=Rurimicrobium arvi TaxID=2049916 RepID=A0ABP8MZQ2_9BACT
MRRITLGLLLTSVLSAGAPDSIACDVCGCSANIQSLGLLPQFSNNFVGLQYLTYHSVSNHPALFEGKPDEHTEQQFRSLQLWGRIRLSQRFQLLAFVPYLHNTNQDTSASITKSGIGDVTLMVNYSVPLKRPSKGERLLLAGLGIKAPTGHYDSLANTGTGLPNVQTGTGSWDMNGNLSYTRRFSRWGYNAEGSFSMTTPNRSRYKFGNKTALALNAFYWKKSGAFTFVPQCGLRVEHALHDYDNYDKKWLNEQTGGVLSFVTAGAQVMLKQAGLRAMAYIPAYQHYATGYVHTRTRWECSVFFLF